VAVAPAGSAPVAAANPDEAAALFRASTTTFDSGDACRAAASFAAFLEKYPSDARAEDAAYLRVLAHQRCGDSAATKEAAQEYLRHYPAGFRRAEIEPLAR
jgi:TolA-binding protein